MPVAPPRQAAADLLLWIDSDTKFLLQRGQDAPELPGPTRSLLEAAARGEAVELAAVESRVSGRPSAAAQTELGVPEITRGRRNRSR